MDQDAVIGLAEVERTALTATFETSTGPSRHGGYFLAKGAETSKISIDCPNRVFDFPNCESGLHQTGESVRFSFSTLVTTSAVLMSAVLTLLSSAGVNHIG
ncbi:MAG: hypothetical protein OXC93_07140 [Rhodospirillaceae bacterium]|nr:hypothetical protein [Rhodospirillaceae bacterium]